MKYPKVTGYWVYLIKTPNDMYYVGYSNQMCCRRWCPLHYQTNSLRPHIEEFGWDRLEKIVVTDGLTKEQALYWENRLIYMYRELGCCINKYLSGGEKIQTEYRQERQKKYRQSEHGKNKRRIYHKIYMGEYRLTDKNKKYHQNYRLKPEWIVYDRVKGYNRNHPDSIIETPLEAKLKYLQTGYIPDYIKSDDLLF